MLNIGILDQCVRPTGMRSVDVLRLSVDAAKAAEELGYKRYWVAEHHAEHFTHSSPEVMITRIASATNRIRVGAGGILLPYYSPLKIAETFLALEALFPLRIDLGVCRGPGISNNAVAVRLLDGNTGNLDRANFSRKVIELSALLEGAVARVDEGPPQPYDVPPPDLWILGSTRESAALAAQINKPYGYMCFYPGAVEAGSEILSVASPSTAKKNDGATNRLIAVTVVCEEHEELAIQAAEEYIASGGAKPNVVGSPNTCATLLHELARGFGLDEVLLCFSATPVYRWETPMRLLSRALSLEKH